MKVKLPLYFVEKLLGDADDVSSRSFKDGRGVFVDAILDIDPANVIMICPYLDNDFKITEMTELGFLDGRVYTMNVPTGEFVKWYQDTFGEKFKELKIKRKDE